MKKLMCLLLSCLLIFLVSVFVYAAADPQKELSEMTESECLAFLESKGVEMPYDDRAYWGKFATEIIAALDEDPYTMFIYNWTEAHEYSEQIQLAYWEHYGIKAENVE